MAQKIVILVLYIALSCAMFSKTNTFSLPMIPIDSPQLKLFPQGLTTQQRHELFMNISMSRASMYSTMSRKKSNPNLNQSGSINSIDTPVFWMPSNYYTTQLFFGSPSFVMSAYVVIDTGSANTWVQCDGCNPCFELKPKNLQVTKSPTYRYLSKDDPRCYPKIIAGPNLCGYQNQYAGGAKISGLVGEDTFIFPDSTTKIPDFFPNIAFACGMENVNVDFGLNTGPNNDIAGILGIAPGPLSFLNQLDSRIKGRFSQCLPPSVYESTGVATMHFGDAAQIGEGPDVRSIKMNSGGPYYLSFRGISVEGERLANLDASKCAFDLVSSSQWNLSSLSFDLPPQIKQRIMDLDPPDDVEPDKPCSTFVNAKGFALTKAYWAQFNQAHSVPCPEWIWDSSYHPKLNFFFWLIWYDRLPHNMLLYSRNIIPSSACKRCSNAEENTSHILVHCPFAHEVWSDTPASCFTSLDTLDAWINANMTCKHTFRGLPWGDIFPSLCFELWKARNKFIFEHGNGPSSRDVIREAVRQVCEFKQAIHANMTNVNPPVSPPMHFIPPPLGWFTIHVDASFVSPMETAGLAGLIRDHHGSWRSGFQRCIYANDALSAEIHSVLEGLKCARGLNMTHIAVYSDCKSAIEMIMTDSNDMGIYTNLVVHCRQLTTSFQGLKLGFHKREFNKVADTMAKQCRKDAVDWNITRTFPHPPSYCMEDLISDCINMYGNS